MFHFLLKIVCPFVTFFESAHFQFVKNNTMHLVYEELKKLRFLLFLLHVCKLFSLSLYMQVCIYISLESVFNFSITVYKINSHLQILYSKFKGTISLKSKELNVVLLTLLHILTHRLLNFQCISKIYDQYLSLKKLNVVYNFIMFDCFVSI